MAGLDSKITEELRDIYKNEFNVVLACAFEPEEKGHEKFGFYEKIGEVINSLGKRPYLPHKEIDLNWPSEKIYDIIDKIVIPCSDIVVAYLGLQSLATGIMIGSAFKNNIKVFYLYETEIGRNAEISMDWVDWVVDPRWREDTYDLIEFKSEEEALKKLKLSLEVFYKQKTT